MPLRRSNITTPAVLVDIDGTLCDARGRDHLLGQDPDWESHSLACEQDPPVEGTIRLVNLLSAKCNIILCSGRSVIATEHTKRWLRKHGCHWDRLMLRPKGNRDNNATYKLSVVKRLEDEGYDFLLAIDDYHKTAKALTDYGIPTVLVSSYTMHGNQEDLLATVVESVGEGQGGA